MKTITTTLIILLIALTGYLGYRYGAPKTGQVVVAQAWLDSLRNVAESIPDTITRTDTIYPPPEVVTIVKEVPVPVESGDTWAYYEDEHKDEWVHISIADTIRNNRIAWREWEYELFVPLHILHTTTITERVPYPYPVKEEVHFSWYGGASFGTDGWRARGGKVYERWLFGVYAGRSMGDNVVGVEVSVMF